MWGGMERQEGKRNATPQDLSYSRGKLYRRRKKKHGGDRKSEEAKSSGQNDHLKSGDTASSVGSSRGCYVDRDDRRFGDA